MHNGLSKGLAAMGLYRPLLMLAVRLLDEGCDRVFEDGVLATIDDDTNREEYEKENKCCGLVPAQPNWDGGTYTRLNAGIRNQMEDQGNGE
jgi:hypothetical protein